MVTKSDLDGLIKFSNLASYISVAQIFLKDNFFLEEKLDFNHIKPRLLGHWGTVPGIIAVFAQILRQSRDNKDRDFLYIVGPGHGFPGYQAGLFIEGSLTYYYPDKIPFSKEGIKEIARGFSSPYKYPSHLNPEAPGVILEGGELGYSLSYAYGSVIDNPNLITITLIGDGEAETGPLFAAWNISKLISPQKDGAVLPILHLNGYKISGPTIFGRMHDKELEYFFKGLGYDVLFVEGDDYKSLHKNLAYVMDKAISKIKLIQATYKTIKADEYIYPRYPIIIMRTPKGMTGPKQIDNRKIEGNCESHQVVFDNLHNDKKQLKILEEWLKSYDIESILSFGKDGSIKLDNDILSILPPQDRRIGTISVANGGSFPLKVAGEDEFIRDIKIVGESTEKDTASVVGDYFALMYKENKSNFRLFSPDETYSNHLNAVFKYTKRSWQLEIKQWDKDLSSSGRVFEILSEHNLAGMLMGYTLTGRTGFFASYEAFAHIVSSMVDQYIKFIKVARNTHFRKPVPSLNIILTSLLERQDHNGFSHQNPSFISSIMNENFDIVDIYFPIDANVAVYSIKKSLYTKNKVSVFVFGKRIKKLFTNKDKAKELVENGVAIFENLSDDVPDFVIATTGDYITQEALFGLSLVREWFHEARVRFVNVLRPNIFELEKTSKLFNYFTADKPVIYLYHGYANSIEKLAFGKIKSDRMKVFGYKESGSTTTPFDMLARNNWTRFDILKEAANILYKKGIIDRDRYVSAIEYADCKLSFAKQYAIDNLDDPEELKY